MLPPGIVFHLILEPLTAAPRLYHRHNVILPRHRHPCQDLSSDGGISRTLVHVLALPPDRESIHFVQDLVGFRRRWNRRPVLDWQDISLHNHQATCERVRVPGIDRRSLIHEETDGGAH